MWVIVIIAVLLIWGNLSRKSPNHPLNKIKVNPKVPLCSHVPTAGDNFNSGTSIVAGVPQPCIPKISCDAGVSGLEIFVPPHALFPVDPPPISIQKKPLVGKPPLPPVKPIGPKICYTYSAPSGQPPISHMFYGGSRRGGEVL